MSEDRNENIIEPIVEPYVDIEKHNTLDDFDDFDNFGAGLGRETEGPEQQDNEPEQQELSDKDLKIAEKKRLKELKAQERAKNKEQKKDNNSSEKDNGTEKDAVKAIKAQEKAKAKEQIDNTDKKEHKTSLLDNIKSTILSFLNKDDDTEVDIADVINEKEAVDMILYVVVDKPIAGLINYFRESGIKVSSIFSDITDAKNTVLMQTEPTRVVVIDTGLGRFTTTSMRAELIDMLGISDEHNKTTVFYTDSVLKIDTIRALGKSSKNINWIPYRSTNIVAGTLLAYNENYVYDLEDRDDTLDSEESILNHKGSNIPNCDSNRMDISGISSDSILAHLVDSEDDTIEEFKITL